MENIFNLGIIGAGPAGYSAAIRAAQKGLSVVLFEKESIGGVCLNKGCIPTKTILHCTDFYKSLKKAGKFGINLGKENPEADYGKIFNRKNEIVLKLQKSLTKLVQSYNVKIVHAEASFVDSNKIFAGDVTYQCDNIIIAAGAKPAQIAGIQTDGEFILNSDDILNLNNLPQNILIIGSGAIGTEWARIFSALEKNVTVAEIADSLLPAADTDVSKRLERIFKQNKIKFFTGTKIENIAGNSVFFSNGQVLTPDIILCAAGREPVIPCGLEFVRNGSFIKVNNNFQTNFSNIFAVGDINGKLLLAHSAIHQAISVVDFIVDKKPVCFDKNKIPSVIYGKPEISMVGKTEQMLYDTDYKVSVFPVSALGKAFADDELDGFVKVLSVDNKITGAHIICPGASSLIHQFALMIDNELKTEDILNTVFAHPSYSEAVFESILGLDGMSLSLPKV